MMTKTQKIWMWIFVAMFAIPEILWGNLIRVFKISFLPIIGNAQYFSENPVLSFSVILIEIIGISGIIYLVNAKPKLLVSNIFKYSLNALLIIILAALLVSLCFSYIISKMTLF